MYKLRLGVDCLEVYNLERSAEELQKRLAEKDSELGRAEGEVDMRELQQGVMDKEEEEVSRSQVMKRKRDQPLESEETRNEREHGLKQHLSLGVLDGRYAQGCKDNFQESDGADGWKSDEGWQT